jgi:hypothetical protein
VTIPISHIDRVLGDTVYLKLDKQAIGSLPAIPVRRREGLDEMVATLRARQEDSRKHMRAQIEAQLQDWSAEIERLKIKAAQADAAPRGELEERIVALRAKREAARAELREKMETQLQVWRTQLEELTARRADARAEAKADLLRQINLLREKRQAMCARLERNIEDDIAELDATIEMITTGMYKMAAEERAEQERRAEELRTRRERALAKLRDLRETIAPPQKGDDKGANRAKAGKSAS